MNQHLAAKIVIAGKGRVSGRSKLSRGCCVGAARSGCSRCSTTQQAQHPEAVRSTRSTTQQAQQWHGYVSGF
ncbi:hypothetical protein [Mucilaginibacter koreensis]